MGGRMQGCRVGRVGESLVKLSPFPVGLDATSK